MTDEPRPVGEPTSKTRGTCEGFVLGRPWLAILAVAAVVAVGAALLNRGPAPVATDVAPPVEAAGQRVVELEEAAQKTAGISVVAVTSVVRADLEEAPAILTLDETHTVRIGSVVDGIVVEATANIGSRVKAGQQLGAIHSVVVHQSWAAHRKALAERRRLTTELTYARQSSERAARLYAAKAISQLEVQRAEADRIAAEEQLDMAEAELKRSLDDLQHYGIIPGEESVPETVEQIPIRSPLSGVVLERFVTPGTAVTIGMPMFVVSDLGTLWAVAEIGETRLGHLAEGRGVEVQVSAYPDQAFPGTITFIGDTFNPKTRRVTVRSTVPNPDGRLKPEMFATVVLGESDPRTVVAVPEGAIQEVDGRSVVFVAAGATRFTPRTVDLGAEVDGLVEVRSGVAVGERVVATGSFLLKSELLKAAMSEDE